MSTIRSFALLAIFLIAACATPSGEQQDVNAPSGKGWKPLLTKLDAAEWDYEAQFWKQDPDGSLHGTYAGGPLHHFMYSKQSYGDFEMHADFKMTGYNSGICIRLEPVNFDNCPGYQVDMGDGYWGSLFEEKGRGIVVQFPKDQVDSVLHRNEWNHYYIVAKGHHIQTWLNGHPTVDTVDEKGRLTGKIGFQLTHTRATDVIFKNMMIRDLN